VSAKSDSTTVQHLQQALEPRAVPSLSWTDDQGPHARAVTERLLVGSASRAALVLASQTVSRVHAEIEAAPDGLRVRDLGSRNGTWSGGVRVHDAVIPRGGRIRFGALEALVGEAAAEAVEQWPEATFHGMVGAAPRARELFALLARVAAVDGPVLLSGETGTGKELCARAVHDASARAAHPFVIIDCGALPESLIEAELFGHARGAFTGALGERAGAFEEARGGTVFLDEIGELPLPVQPKLLRVLEARTVRRVGESHQRRVDFRVVAATHRDLPRMVACGAFREDLYFRLAVLPVRVPSLRERAEDIPRLLERFLGAAPAALLGADVTAALARQPWLGNVRELRSFVERVQALGPAAALALARADTDRPVSTELPRQAAPAPADASELGSFKDHRERCVDRGEAEYVRAILARHGGNVTEAARAADINRSHLYRLIRKHGA